MGNSGWRETDSFGLKSAGKKLNYRQQRMAARRGWTETCQERTTVRSERLRGPFRAERDIVPGMNLGGLDGLGLIGRMAESGLRHRF